MPPLFLSLRRITSLNISQSLIYIIITHYRLIIFLSQKSFIISVFSTRSHISNPSLTPVNSPPSRVITYSKRFKDKCKGEVTALGRSISAIKANIIAIIYLDIYLCEISISYYRNRGGSRGRVYSVHYSVILLRVLLARGFSISESSTFLLVFRGMVPILLAFLLLLFSSLSRPSELLRYQYS